MKPIERDDGRWAVFVPRKLSESGKRECRYFPSKNQAAQWIKEFKTERREHGRSGITADQREWITYAKNELGDLALLPRLVQHWRRTGEQLNPVTARDAVKMFTDASLGDYPNQRTWSDITERLGYFAEHFQGRFLHELSVRDLESFLNKFAAGWNRWSEHKRLRPFYRYAKRHNWIATDLVEQMPVPKVPLPERRIYTPDQFQKLLWAGETQYRTLLPFIVLSGFCFLRTSELVRRFAAEEVLRWEHILWSEDLIHVPQGVAKSTRRRQGDERLVPLSSAAKNWLKPIRQKTGDCVSHGSTHFGKLWRAMTDSIGVERIDNGLRHSAISYSLAANPEHGVALTAQWAGNSEATIRKHYLRLIKPAQGLEWFAVRHAGPRRYAKAWTEKMGWSEEMEQLQKKIRALQSESPESETEEPNDQPIVQPQIGPEESRPEESHDEWSTPWD